MIPDRPRDVLATPETGAASCGPHTSILWWHNDIIVTYRFLLLFDSL